MQKILVQASSPSNYSCYFDLILYQKGHTAPITALSFSPSGSLCFLIIHSFKKFIHSRNSFIHSFIHSFIQEKCWHHTRCRMLKSSFGRSFLSSSLPSVLLEVNTCLMTDYCVLPGISWLQSTLSENWTSQQSGRYVAEWKNFHTFAWFCVSLVFVDRLCLNIAVLYFSLFYLLVPDHL